jgi:hypothetical protein
MQSSPYVTIANACAEASRRLPHLPANVCPRTLIFLRADISGAELVSIASAIGVSTLELVRCIGIVWADLRSFAAPAALAAKVRA